MKVRNYCAELALQYAYKVKQNNGISDPNLLVGESFHVFFINYFADTYIFEAVDAIKCSKFYRHEVKQIIKSVDCKVNDHNNTFTRSLDGITDKFSNYCLNLDEAFGEHMKHLHDSIFAIIKDIKHLGDKETEALTRLCIAVRVSKLAADNIKRRIEESKKINPVIALLNWTDHSPINKDLVKLQEKLGVPSDVDKDLTVKSVWFNLEKKWNSPEFIAESIGFTEQEFKDTLKTVQ